MGSQTENQCTHLSKTPEMLLYGVRRLAEEMRRRQYSGLWLSVEEVEAVLSCIPKQSNQTSEMNPTTPKPSECTDSELPPEVQVEKFALEGWRDAFLPIGATVRVRTPVKLERVDGEMRFTGGIYQEITITPELLARHAK